jgi:hypothetical protein
MQRATIQLMTLHEQAGAFAFSRQLAELWPEAAVENGAVKIEDALALDDRVRRKPRRPPRKGT